MLERFGFTGDKLTTRVGDLSGGERRRLQILRLLLDEPNVLLLDEPTNDLDIETLTVLEDFLDGWPGTLVVVSHDRYFLERTCDAVHGAARRRLAADAAAWGRGVPRAAARRRAVREHRTPAPPAATAPATSEAGQPRGAQDHGAARAPDRAAVRAGGALHDRLAAHASDFERLASSTRSCGR